MTTQETTQEVTPETTQENSYVFYANAAYVSVGAIVALLNVLGITVNEKLYSGLPIEVRGMFHKVT